MLTTSGKEFSTYLTCYTPFVSSITGVVYVFFSQYQRGKVESPSSQRPRTAQASYLVYTGLDKFLKGKNLHGILRTRGNHASLWTVNSTAICNRISTVPCKRSFSEPTGYYFFPEHIANFSSYLNNCMISLTVHTWVLLHSPHFCKGLEDLHKTRYDIAQFT